MHASDFWGEPISVYTREQAIEDGVLIDVTDLAKQTGFRIPVVLTAALWARCETEAPTPRAAQERTRDVVWAAYRAVQSALDHGRMDRGPFPFWVPIWRTSFRLWIDFHAAEGFTVGFPEDF